MRWTSVILLLLLLVPISPQSAVISEFMADNESTLLDEDGDPSDWIELHNPGTNSLSLDGWFLTDLTNNPTRWRFPSVTIPPRGFLVVFASGKNRATAGSELHVDFQIDKDRPFLALISGDGQTVASQFGPDMPAQRADTSYGLGMQTIFEPAPPTDPLPPETLNPYVWLRSDAGVTTNTTGRTVVTWLDQSTNAFVFRANHPRATANDPSVTTGPSPGSLAINFDGTDLIDSDSSLQLFTSANSPLSAFVMLRPASINGNQRFVVNHAPGAAGQSYELGQDAGQVSPPGAWSIHRGSGQATSTGPNSLVAGQYRLTTAEVLASGTAGANVRFYTNGVLRPNATGNWTAPGSYHTGADPLAIGARVDNKGQGFDTLTPDGYFVGDIAELILYRASLSSHQRQGVENFLLNKYGFTPPTPLIARPMIIPGQVGFFQTATPGAINGSPVVDFVADTKFAPDRGFYVTNISVTIACATPGAVIRFTTNSEPPTASSTLYTAPIPIARTTVLRAAAFKEGWASSDIDTHTYIFLDDVIRQPANPPGFPTTGWGEPNPDYEMDPEVVTNAAYSSLMKPALLELPTLSLVTAKSNLWHATYGIYSHPDSEGDAWERPVSFEYIHPATAVQFQSDAGVRIHGGVSRTSGVKLALRVYFRGRYELPKLRFPLFEDSPVAEFDNLVLRSQWNDGWAHTFDNNRTAVYLRDEWCRRAFVDMGGLTTIGNFMHVYIDGLYWGLYNPVEQINAAFVATHRGGSQTNYDVLKFNSGVEAADGDTVAWNALMARAEAGLAGEAAYRAILPLVNVTDLADFMVHYIFVGNEDGPAKNYYAWRRRAPSGPFGFIVWDNEWVLGHSFSGHDKLDVNVVNADAANSATRLYTRLRPNAEFRVLFGDRVHRHFFNDGVFGPSAAIARYRALLSGITNAIIGESARWGDVFNTTNPGHPFTRNIEWAAENNYLLNTWFVQRPAVVLQQLRAAGLYPNVSAPVFSQYGGLVSPGFSLSMAHTNGAGTIYFTVDGTDPRLPGGSVSARAQPFSAPITINGNTHVRARVLTGSSWSALVEATFNVAQYFNGLAITEVMYHPPSTETMDGDAFEFIELKNTSPSVLDLSGLFFAAGVNFTFSNGVTLAPGAFALLVRDATQFGATYPGVPVAGVYSGGLANGGETLALAHPVLGQVLAVSYDDDSPWPATPDGFGFSLVPAAGNYNSDRALNWRASTAPGGSPGADDPQFSIAPIVINELLSNSDPPDLDFIELHNPTSNNVAISGWFLTDDRAVPQKFRITNSIIPPGGYITFDESHFANTNSPSAFALNSLGDEIFLFSGDGTNLTGYSHSAEFGAAAPGVAFGRYRNSVGEDFFPAQLSRTPSAANPGPLIGPLVITEINYHAPDIRDEFVEIRNISPNTVSLFDPAYPTNTWKLNGLGFTFPADVEVPPGGLLLLVSSDPPFFRERHGINGDVQVFRYAGNLQDSGENLELHRPGTPGATVPYITIDAIRYNDRAPWPIAADGVGASLQKRSIASYANEPTNWFAATPNPGADVVTGAPPRIMTHPQDRTAAIGDTVVFVAEAASSAPLHYQWRFNGSPVFLATNDTLVLSNVQITNAGSYGLAAYNVAGSALSSNATLTILQPPRLALHPESQTVRVGSNVTLHVIAESSSPLQYQWRRNDVNLPGANASTLAITDVQIADEGTYTVVVSNAVAAVESDAAIITVISPAAFLQPPLGQSIVVNGNITLSAVISGHPPPFLFQWRRTGSILTNMIQHDRTNFFALTNVQTSDAGGYFLVVTNLASGSLIANFSITVLPDTDTDGVPDAWEATYGLNPTNHADGSIDLDLDGLSNWREYIAGTNPTNNQSALRLSAVSASGSYLLTFQAESNRTYSVQHSEFLAPGSWLKLTDIPAAATNRSIILTDLPPPRTRFYRIVVPRLP